ncbi:MAG: peroxiredoxin [Pseudomonadota bacterium]
MLSKGDKAPEFTLPDDDGNTVSLTSLLSNGPLVLYFYPADFTPGCTKEACDIRDMHDDISDVGLQVVGVSPQGSESHARFRDKHNLPFKLLDDSSKEVIRAYGVNGPLGFGVRRATFLISKEGMIEDVVLADLMVGRHGDFIRDAVASMTENN